MLVVTRSRPKAPRGVGAGRGCPPLMRGGQVVSSPRNPLSPCRGWVCGGGYTPPHKIFLFDLKMEHFGAVFKPDLTEGTRTQLQEEEASYWLRLCLRGCLSKAAGVATITTPLSCLSLTDVSRCLLSSSLLLSSQSSLLLSRVPDGDWPLFKGFARVRSIIKAVSCSKSSLR